MSCGHPVIVKETHERLRKVRCVGCGHAWNETPIWLSDEEYDACTDLMVLYLNPKRKK